MAELVYFEKEEDGDDVHEGGIELEAGMGWTQVVAGREESLSDQGSAQSVVNAILFGDPLFQDKRFVSAVLEGLLAVVVVSLALATFTR